MSPRELERLSGRARSFVSASAEALEASDAPEVPGLEEGDRSDAWNNASARAIWRRWKAFLADLDAAPWEETPALAQDLCAPLAAWLKARAPFSPPVDWSGEGKAG